MIILIKFKLHVTALSLIISSSVIILISTHQMMCINGERNPYKNMNNSKMYFKKLGTVQLSNENWKLITYIDMQHVYMQRLDRVRDRYNELKKFFNKECSEYCYKITITIQRAMHKIK